MLYRYAAVLGSLRIPFVYTCQIINDTSASDLSIRLDELDDTALTPECINLWFSTILVSAIISFIALSISLHREQKRELVA